MKTLVCPDCGKEFKCYKSIPISNDLNTIKKRYYKCVNCSNRIYTFEYIDRKVVK